MAHANFKDHLVIQTGSTKELSENKAALNLLQLLMNNYDLCDDINTVTYKGKTKSTNRSTTEISCLGKFLQILQYTSTQCS